METVRQVGREARYIRQAKKLAKKASQEPQSEVTDASRAPKAFQDLFKSHPKRVPPKTGCS
eukprot:6534505-Karenia_brevis.AAC.1